MNDRIRELGFFLRVSEEESFSAAARSLDLDPSTISKVIQRLENRLGVRLFHRTSRVLQLTQEGEQFLAAAQIHTLEPKAVAAANNGDMLCTLATMGLGITRLADYHVDAELKSGQLVKLLDAHGLEREPIYAVFASKRHLSPRVRVFLDHARQALGDG
jgi:DNA-binding transcriptional LysR family regulator